MSALMLFLLEIIHSSGHDFNHFRFTKKIKNKIKNKATHPHIICLKENVHVWETKEGKSEKKRWEI